ncbi:MAG TPA: hypothetical protein VGO62_00170 [Myxococcota bacterium]
MDLVRELKQLNARKKAGEALNATDESRRKELKAYLRTTLEAQGGASVEDSAIKEQPQRSSSGPKEMPLPRPVGSAPKPVPAAMPAPAVVTPTPPPMARSADVVTKAAPRPVSTPSVPSAMPTQGGGRPAMIESLDEDLPPPTPPPQAAPKPFVPKKNAFAIDASSLIDAASKSEAVNKVDPFANRKAHASAAEVEDAEARAEAAVRANKKKDRAKNADEAEEQLHATEAAYTPPEDSFVLEQYYGDFFGDGFVTVNANEAGDLKPVDPREIELAKLDVTIGSMAGSTSAAVPAGLAFLDDFPALYAKRVLPAADDEVVVDSTDPNLLIPGKRRVTVHLLNGEKKQGAIRSLRRGELGFKLEPLGSGQTEELSISQVKAVFIHVQANASLKEAAGRNLTATFRDGRSVQGSSDDYQPGAPVFTLVPPQGRGGFERIIVNGAAVTSVS